MSPIKVAPSLFALMGSMDWLTTVIGVAYFGAIESNIFIEPIIGNSLPAFTAIKLGSAFFFAFVFYQAEKDLNRAAKSGSKNYRIKQYVLRSCQIVSILIMLIAVLNNVLIIVALSA